MIVCEFSARAQAHRSSRLENQEIPTLFGASAAQGCAAIFNDRRSLKMKLNKNHIFYWAYSENARMA
ncbi:MAG TPA: hypothetical protein VJN01_13375, partial [Xanthomonadales bacterium]|nr:hypothetical protein [Xanthomonadales bacterium]